MKVKVLYFASLKGKINKDYEEIEIKENSTIKDLRDFLIKKYPELKDLLNNCMIAKNEEYVDIDTVLNEDDLIAFIPPVGGG